MAELYNEALNDQLVRSTRENIWTLVFRMDFTSFGPYFKIAVQIFSFYGPHNWSIRA